MTTIQLPTSAKIVTSVRPPGLWRRVSDVASLTYRNLVHIAREPLQLSDVTIQPILFTALFVYVFGAGITMPHGGSYAQYAIAGMLALNLTTSAMGTAVGLSNDLNGGIIDRFRSLPMWRPAVLVGRSMTDLLTALICTAFVAGTGLLVGWRPERGILYTLAGFAVFWLFSYALSWGCACLGIISKGPESAQGVGTRHPLPVGHCLERPRAHGAHAGSASFIRQLESRQRRHGRGPTALRQPEPVNAGARVADAAPHRGVAAVVARPARDLRATGQLPLPAPHDGLSSERDAVELAQILFREHERAPSMLSRRCARDDVPGIRRIFEERCINHARATASDVVSRRVATEASSAIGAV